MNVTGIVLAAGFGTRLRPSTEFCPKPLIPVAGVEPLFHALFQFRELGIQDVVINTHYLPHKIEAALERWKGLLPELRLHVSYEPEILGTGGAIQQIIQDFPKLFEGKGLMLINGDTFARIDLQKLTANDEQSSFAFSRVKEHLEKYNLLWVGSDLSWQGIGQKSPEKDSSAVHFLGVHYLCAKDVKFVKDSLPTKSEVVDLFNAVYRPLADHQVKVRGVEVISEISDYGDHCYWFDMTNQEYLLEAQHFLLGSTGPGPDWQNILKARFPNIREFQKGVWIDAALSDGLKLIGPSVYVDNSKSTFKRAFPGLELGPYASLICEEIGLCLDSFKGGRVSVKNSVLFLTDKSKVNDRTPSLIEDEVRVW
ncbi:NTP transferase domain-containing protein [bacterium]|nr:NTP transferase domain-containing protein [bacterium]